MYIKDLGITITPGEGVTDVTEEFIASGYEVPKPGTSPAKSEPKDKQVVVTTMPESSEEVKITGMDVEGGGVYKTAEKQWYKSPWLWGGVAVLAVAGTTAAIYFRRRRAY